MTSQSSTYRTRGGKYRPILHVRVIGQIGEKDCEASIDAPSTAEGLAYFLRSRGLQPDVTEGDIIQGVIETHRDGYEHRVKPTDTIIVDCRDIGGYAWGFRAEVEK
jgi:hypothetical protein